LPHYTDKNSILRTSAPAPLGERSRGEKARSHFGRALRELGIEWIAAHSPQASHGRLGWQPLGRAPRRSLRGAQAEIERRLDGSHWLRFRGRYLRLRHCPGTLRPSASPSGLRPPGLAEQIARPENKIKNKIKPQYHVPAKHPWRKPCNRTFLSCEKPDISTLR
jgi:hypothetical protein